MTRPSPITIPRWTFPVRGAVAVLVLLAGCESTLWDCACDQSTLTAAGATFTDDWGAQVCADLDPELIAADLCEADSPAPATACICECEPVGGCW